MDTHNIGGLRRLGRPHWEFPFPRRWETADIAVLVFVYQRDKLIAKKIGLLQSKRLFPENHDVEDDDEAGFLFGMNAFLGRDGTQAIESLHRQFTFSENCIYGAIAAGSNQIHTIDELNRSFGNAIYYLFYNPHELPLSVSFPLPMRTRIKNVTTGCRIFEASQVHAATNNLSDGHSPSYRQILAAGNLSNWPLETWAADLLLTCKVGQQFDESNDAQVRYFLERRSGPIGAALAVSITLPQ
jgi:hypothetical protein